MKSSKIIIVIGVILLALLVWGLIGSSEAAKLGTNCDIGIGKDGSAFCWKWHQNILGEIGDEINQAVNG
ncbi:hypothetical protein J4474_03250 [Candidatus Pacearchaeota archaeon]|nr:hypothetical protein [Candidatus Pacearchaeota archaeon]